jgi:deoxyribodipyrimidine photolyase-related protein
VKTLRLILGDQLNRAISSLSDVDKDQDTIFMCEVMEEATYVRHHQKKIALVFSAMRHFAEELEKDGFTVDYVKLDDGAASFSEALKDAVKKHQPERVIATKPGEYRVLKAMEQWEHLLGLPVELREDDRFMCSINEFADWAEGRKQLRMEYFYREMRKKHGVLMQGDQPEGGEWNYDVENRKPPKAGLDIPAPYNAQTDDITREVMALVADRFGDHFGDLEPFHFAVTRDQALYALGKFIDERLPTFGDYQDAMVQGEPWMFHAHIGFYLNCGLLLPAECVHAAEETYHRGDAPLNAVEGFIRQILGWREYVRGIYWLKMPEYKDENFLEAKRALPDFYWTGETELNCLKQCITETKQNAYAHHIQRLMVLGNFALLAGIHPDEVNEWYLIVYADAYEWVELPNVSGMVLFADGGLLASKPYAAGGAYINKMSNYCKDCRYSPTVKEGEKACPFNYLYWDFLDRNAEKLSGNARLGMMYKNLARMDTDKLKQIRCDAKAFLEEL